MLRSCSSRTQAIAVALGIFAGLSAAACHRSGLGSGDLLSPPAAGSGAENAVGQAAFNWRSGSDPSHGQIQVKLTDGRFFEGDFLQLTQSSVQSFTPYWSPWGYPAGWGAPGVAYAGPPNPIAFVTEYSGQIVAHLRGPNGQKLRCLFVLKDPPSGLGGGAVGDCWLSSGESIFGVKLAK